MLFSMPRIIQHSYNFFCSRTPKPKLWIFSSRTPKPKLQTVKLEGSGTKKRPRIRPQECLVSIDLPPHSGDLSLQLTDVVTLLLGNPLLYYAPNILNRPDIWKLWALKSVLIRNPRGWFDLAQPNFFSIHSANTTLLALWSSVSFCVLYLW